MSVFDIVAISPVILLQILEMENFSFTWISLFQTWILNLIVFFLFYHISCIFFLVRSIS